MEYTIIRSDELTHHGIKGQKWGVRRFQNEDRTWTEAGKERYGSGNDGDKKSSGGSAGSSKSGRKGLTDGQKKALKTAAVVAGTAAVAGLAVYAGTKYVDAVKTEAFNQTMESGKRAIAQQESMSKAWRDIAKDYNLMDKDLVDFTSARDRERDLKSVTDTANFNSSSFKNARATLKGNGVRSIPEIASREGRLTSARQSHENHFKDNLSKAGYSFEDYRGKKGRTINIYDTRTAEGKKRMAAHVSGKDKWGPLEYQYINKLNNH